MIPKSFLALCAAGASFFQFSHGAFAAQPLELELPAALEPIAETPATPEPSSAFLAAIGGLVLLFVMVRRK